MIHPYEYIRILPISVLYSTEIKNKTKYIAFRKLAKILASTHKGKIYSYKMLNIIIVRKVQRFNCNSNLFGLLHSSCFGYW